jgi:predicted CoA-substrate-specific enzyme activase
MNNTKPKSGGLYAGIDSGSTTTNMVVLNDKKEVLASAIVRTGAKAQNGAQAALEAVCGKLSIAPEALTAILATGYGRGNIPFATDTKTEITCHARGAYFLNPATRTIVDIGGQDSKVICLDETGAVTGFIMNDKCAAGTGRFLEMMARTLELDMDEMSRRGLSWKKDLTISSMCTVFAESEVISLIADNHTDSDIIHGLNKSIAAKTASMVSRAKGAGPFMMTGGVARNKGVVQELEGRLGESLFITENPDLCGALGAALFALEEG